MARIFHSHLHGTRNAKYDRLIKSDIGGTSWLEILPQTPFHLLIPQDTQLLSEYEQGWKVTEIMPVNSAGIVTGQDNQTIAFQESDAQLLANKHELPESVVTPILYRPFDSRFVVYDSKVITRPRSKVMRHMFEDTNIGMAISRSVRGAPWRDALVSENIIEFGVMATRPGNSAPLFPLYLYPGNEQAINSCCPNLSSSFLKNIVAKLGYTPTPEAIFYYIYAIFHSPTYRSRYAEFLKIDFPRVPLTSNDRLFRKLATYGEQLVALHLMKAPQLDKPIAQFVEQGGNRIVDPAHPKYSNGKVTINKKGDGFTGVPEEVWNFYVGGYPVCAKWLKDRKGCTLSYEDIIHYQRIVVALQETIKLMAAIDKAIPNWPIE